MFDVQQPLPLPFSFSDFQHFSFYPIPPMNTLPLDLRQRIVDAYDAGQGTRDEIAIRFGVSTGMVKKLLQQRRDTGDIAPRHQHSGRKPIILPSHRKIMRKLLSQKNNITLVQMRQKLGLQCSLSAIHHVLTEMGLKLHKKCRSVRGDFSAHG
jgi:transposase